MIHAIAILDRKVIDAGDTKALRSRGEVDGQRGHADVAIARQEGVGQTHGCHSGMLRFAH